MDIEKRLRDHLTETGQQLTFDSAEPSNITGAEPSRSGKLVQAVAAVLVLAMAGGGFWLVSGDDDGVTEIAAGDVEDAEAADDQESDDADDAPSESPPPDDGSPSESEAERSGDVGGGDGASSSGPGTHSTLELTAISSDASPGFGQVFIDNGIYYVLSTAPGRVSLDYQTLSDDEIQRLVRPNTFYSYEDGSGWTSGTVDDRFVADFDVRDGLLYAISTGGLNSSQASIGTSSDRGQSWSWTPVAGLEAASQATIMATDDQPIVFASRWGTPDFDRAIELAEGVGIELTTFTLFSVDNERFSYAPVPAEDLCDAVLAQFFPILQEMRSIPDVSPEELRWIIEEIERNGCEAPEDLDSIAVSPYELPEPVTKTWAGLGITPPEDWSPWAGLFRFDGQGLDPLDLPFGGTAQASYTTKNEGRMAITVFDPQINTGLDATDFPEGETVFITTDGNDWTEEFRPYPQPEDGYFEGLFVDSNNFVSPTVGGSSFRVWWEESGEAAAVPEGEFIEPVPMLQRKSGDEPWETLDVAGLAPDVDLGPRQIWDVRGSDLGVFLLFGPLWDDDGNPSIDTGLALYSGDGVQWNSLEFDGQDMQFINNGEELMMFVTDFQHDDGHYSETTIYLVSQDG